MLLLKRFFLIFSRMKTRLIVWGSSHVHDRHHFPHLFETEFKNQRRFLSPIVYAKPGGRMDQEFVNRIIQDIEENSPNPQIHVVILSSNNLRRPSFYTPENVVELYSQLVGKVTQTTNVRFILSGIVPSPCTEPFSKERFRKFDALLKDLCLQNERTCFYFDSPKYLCREGLPCKQNFSHDGIHLSLEGCKILCAKLKSVIFCIPKF